MVYLIMQNYLNIREKMSPFNMKALNNCSKRKFILKIIIAVIHDLVINFVYVHNATVTMIFLCAINNTKEGK